MILKGILNVKRASIFLSVILYIIIYLGNNYFFGDFVYLWILGLLVIFP